jgi:hypothetical protein
VPDDLQVGYIVQFEVAAAAQTDTAAVGFADRRRGSEIDNTAAVMSMPEVGHMKSVD